MYCMYVSFIEFIIFEENTQSYRAEIDKHEGRQHKK